MSEQPDEPQPEPLVIKITVDTSRFTRALDSAQSAVVFASHPDLNGAVWSQSWSWEHGPDTPCGDECVCPVHGTPLIYWPARDDHACQDANCRYGHGMKGAGPVRPDEEPTT